MNVAIETLFDSINLSVTRLRREKKRELALFFLLCVALNLIGGIDLASRKFFFLDMLGTALASLALGPWWGAGVGATTNLLLYYLLPSSPSLMVFSLVNILGGLYWGYTCNVKLLRPLEGLKSIDTILKKGKDVGKVLWFILMSGGLFLSVPSLLILRYVLGFIGPDASLSRYFYYISVGIIDKLLCVLIATVLICSFFPGLAGNLTREKKQLSYGVSTNSIYWFTVIYLIIFLHLIFNADYLGYWYIWILPLFLALFTYWFSPKHKEHIKPKKFDLSNIAAGGMQWIILIGVVSFFVYNYYALVHAKYLLNPLDRSYYINRKYDDYKVVANGGQVTINYKEIFADSTSLAMVIILMGSVFAILITALKLRERVEVISRVEMLRDKIATDIHNDPLQLISLLKRKLPKVESNIKSAKDCVEHLKINANPAIIQMLEKKVNEVAKTMDSYNEYIPELDSGIRKIIKPLSQKDSLIVTKIGFIRKCNDLLSEFQDRNPRIKIEKDITITDSQITTTKSEVEDWQVEIIKIIREVLNNIEKHAQASLVTIEIRLKESKKSGKKNHFIVSITDNGLGFNPSDKVDNPNSFGLYEIITRSRLIGSSLNINYLDETAQRGTIVYLDLPLD